jgi:hypothetical protein
MSGELPEKRAPERTETKLANFKLLAKSITKRGQPKATVSVFCIGYQESLALPPTI